MRNRSTRRARFEALEDRRLLAYGDVDAEFGERTYAIDFELSFDDFANTAASAPDGATLIGGTSEGRGTLLRVLPNGILDPEFDQDGISYFVFEDADKTSITHIKPLSDGSILIVGFLVFAAERQPFVAKVSSDGALDTSYGTGGLWLGRVNTGLFVFDSSSDDLYLVESRHIELSGVSARERVVVKLTESGALDESFGNAGRTESVVAQNKSIGSVSSPLFMLNNDDGLSFGFSWPDSVGSRQLWTVRFTADGQLDTSFAEDGTSEVQIGTISSGNWHYLGDGEFLVVERVGTLHLKVRVQKVNYLSGLDAQFGNIEFPYSEGHGDSGGVSLEKSGVDTYQAAWIEADWGANQAVIYSTAFNSQGVVDLDYGTNGVQLTRHDKRIVLNSGVSAAFGSHLLVGAVDFPRDISVLEIDSQGHLVEGFGIGGHARFDLTQATTMIHSFEIHGDGSSHYVAFSKPEIFAVAVPGQHFQGDLKNAQLTTELVPYEHYSSVAGRSHLLASGKSVLAQHSRTAKGFAIVLDFFDQAGKRRVAERIEIAAPYSIDSFNFVDLQNGNALLVADTYGSQSDGLGYAILVMLSAEGKLVTDFASQGVKRFPRLQNRVAQVIPVDDGFRLILSNKFAAKYSNRMLVMAIDENGDTISSFGNDGVVELLRSTARHVIGTNTDLGLLLLINTAGDYKLMRVAPDGSLDRDFGSMGLKDVPLTATDQLLPVELVWSNDELIFGATAGDRDAFGEVLVTNSAGDPNLEFGVSGVVTLNLGPSSDHLTSLVPLIDGSILVGMEQRHPNGIHGVVLRLDGPDPSKRPWHNIYQPLNVTADRGDRVVSPLDALIVINFLNRGGIPEGFVDTNGDGFFTALDALLVINHLNLSSISGEGESSGDETPDLSWTWQSNHTFFWWGQFENLRQQRFADAR